MNIHFFPVIPLFTLPSLTSPSLSPAWPLPYPPPQSLPALEAPLADLIYTTPSPFAVFNLALKADTPKPLAAALMSPSSFPHSQYRVYCARNNNGHPTDTSN
jgi:hypothetical protein